jgi:hypothetical protein
MSTTTPNSGRTQTLNDRRRDVLQEQGILETRATSLGAANSTLFWILITVIARLLSVW